MTRFCTLCAPGSDFPVFEIDEDMIAAGVDALGDFELDDGSSLAERVVEVFLAMYSNAHSQIMIRSDRAEHPHL